MTSTRPLAEAYLMTLAFLNRKNTIFHCPARNLFSTEEYITFEEWVPQDITDDSDPLRQQHETVEIHAIMNQTYLEKADQSKISVYSAHIRVSSRHFPSSSA